MDDLISRAAAIDEIGKLIKEYRENGEEEVADGMIIARRYGVKQLPAVNAVPVVHGEWVEEPDRTGHYHCSNCGIVWGIIARAMKYCPNCAAMMMNSPMWEVGDAK